MPPSSTAGTGRPTALRPARAGPRHPVRLVSGLFAAALILTGCFGAQPQRRPPTPAEQCEEIQQASGRSPEEVCAPPYGTHGTRPSAEATTPAAPADPAVDGLFLDRLRAAGLPVEDPARAVSEARGVCEVLDTHSSRGEAAVATMAVQNANGWTRDQAAVLVATAVRTYCPSHEDAVG